MHCTLCTKRLVSFQTGDTIQSLFSSGNGPLDRECFSYNITITAADEGTPSLSSSTVITVHISDVNDNAPRFPAPVINAFLSENGQAGGLVTKCPLMIQTLVKTQKFHIHC